MKRIMRGVGVVVGIILLVVVGLTLFLPVDRIADRVEKELEEATGAEVSIGGARLSLIPRLGVSLQDVSFSGHGKDLARITGSENHMGAYEGMVGKLVVKVPLRPLLKKQAMVEAADLSNLGFEAVYKGENLVLAGGQLRVSDLELDLENLPSSDQGGQKVGDRIPESLVLAFEGEADAYSQKDIVLEQVVFAGALDTRILTIEEWTGRMGPGRLEGSLEIDYERNPDGILDFEARAEGVPANRLLTAWLPDVAERLESDLDGQVRGNVQLGDQETIDRTMNMTGKLVSGDGILHARDWLQEVIPYLGNRQDLVDVRFRGLTHDLRLEQGRYLIDDLQIDGLDTRWSGNGSVGLDGEMDLDLSVWLPEGFTPDLGQWSFLADGLRDETGRVKLDLGLTGPSARPQVGVNLGPLQDAAGSQTGEALKKGLGGLLDKWKSR